MGTLKAGISINGGESNPSSLEERELYLNTTDMKLWSSKGLTSGVSMLNSHTSDETKTYTNNYLNTALNADGRTDRVGNFDIEKSTGKAATWKTSGISDSPSSVDDYNTLDSVFVNKLVKLVLTNLSSSNTIYGSTLPATGTQGQIFFKVK